MSGAVDRYWTAQQVLDQAALECSLAAPGSGVYASTDANVVLLRSLLNLVGHDLAQAYAWPALVKEHSITVVNPGDTGDYALPVDWNGMVEQSWWNRTDNRMLGVSGPQIWQYRKANTGIDPIWVEFRLHLDQFRVLPAPPANGTVIAFEYRSRYWARATGTPQATGPDKAAPTASTDILYFEPGLLVAGLRLRFLEARGLDTTAALVTFERRYDAAVSTVSAAPVVPIGGTARKLWIDNSNLPDTGWGV